MDAIRKTPVTSLQLSGHDANAWVQRFATHPSGYRHVNKATMECYSRDVLSLVRWAERRQQKIIDLGPADLADYLGDRQHDGMQPATLARNLSSFRCFFEFLIEQRVLDTNPVDAVARPAVPRAAPRLLSDGELTSLMQQPEVPRYPSLIAYRAYRNFAMVCMLYASSRSITAIRLLEWRHIRKDERLVALLMALRRVGEASGLERANSRYCFPNSTGLPMTRQALCEIMRRRARDCGIDLPVTPSLVRQSGRRRSGAADLLPTPIGSNR